MNREHPPWTISLQAKAKTFNFKFKATRYLPACYNFFQFSLFLKISSLMIKVSSDNNQPTRRKSLKSKITEFIERFRSVPTKRKTVAAQNPSRIKKLNWISCQGPLCATTVVIGNLALLIQSISDKDVKGIIVHCFSILLYILTLLKTFIRTRNNKLILVSILLMVGYPVWVYMKNNSSHGRRIFAWRCIWKILNWAGSHGFLHSVAQYGLPGFKEKSVMNR
ncbi:hypothetical protein L1987_01486 [Smallanthus sonchifolius]|uniref:Uncharacterized protein n=1 Tax=Smallanthus sonchifolius TaxID=185202 RepID=A0ACB9K586_9ASTR|nr:hypothetical protein L1987_01486 [Smallanthus sonchifolius]